MQIRVVKQKAKLVLPMNSLHVILQPRALFRGKLLANFAAIGLFAGVGSLMIQKRRFVAGSIIASWKGTFVRLLVRVTDLMQPQLGLGGGRKTAPWECTRIGAFARVNPAMVREIFEKGRGERASGTHAAKAALPRMLLEVVSHFVGRFTYKVARWVAATECACRRGFFTRLKGRNNQVAVENQRYFQCTKLQHL